MFWSYHDVRCILFFLITSVFRIFACCDDFLEEQTEDSFDSSFQSQTITLPDYRPSPEPGDTFQEIQEEGKFFVDKTPFLQRLLDGGGKFFYYFSPDTDKQKLRTILVQMMISFFKGEKTYFENLSIYERGNGDQRGEWVEYPIVYLDFAALDLKEEEIVNDFKRKLRNELVRIATVQYGLQCTEEDDFLISRMLEDLANQKKRPVVILIDNYGFPERMIQLCCRLAGWEQKEEILGYRKTFMEFIRNCSSVHSKMVFVTGSTGYDFTRTDGLNFDYFVHVNPDHFDVANTTPDDLSDDTAQ